MNALVPLTVLIPLLGAAGALILGRRPAAQRLVTVLALVAVLGVSVALLVVVDREGVLVMEVGGWAAPYGIVLVVDRLSALLLVVSAVVLLAVLLFSVGQGQADGDDDDTPVTIYYPTYLILAAGVVTAFIAGDLFNLYVGFEILLVASYVLITLGGTEARIRTGTTYIVVSLVSSALFLGSIAMIYGAVGTVNLAQIAQRMADIPPETQTLLHIMLLIGFGIKAAVFPLSFWLPDSYPTAPAPVTAVFAGLLTKVGVYAIIRTETLIFPGPELNSLLLIVALLTMVVGVLGAVAQTDIKRLLSFTLVSHIGFMILGIGLGTVAGTAAAIYYIVHHIIVQTTLFLAAGLIERIGGTTAVPKLGGLIAASPLVAVVYLVPALNLGGIPPFSGFLGKLGLFEAAVVVGTPLAIAVVVAGALVSLLTLYALIRVWSQVFWRPQGEGATGSIPVTEPAPGIRSQRIPRLMAAATIGLTVVGVALTLFAGPLFDLSSRAGEGLEGRIYIEAVFPPAAAGEAMDD